MHVAIRDGQLGVMSADWFEGLTMLGINSTEVAVDRPGAVGGPGLLREGEEPFDLRTAQGRKALKARFDENGAIINAFMMGNDFAAEDLKAETEWLAITCEAAEEIGVPAVRIDCLPHREMDDELFMARAVGAIQSALNATSRVDLGMENHGHVSNRPEFIDDLFGRVGDRRMGLTLDTGNFYWFGHPLDKVYEIMETFADRVYHTHVKNISYPQELRQVQREVGYKYGEYVCPIYDGDIDHARVAGILKAAGYDRDLSIEDEGIGKFGEDERKVVMQKNVDHLKACIGAA